MQARGKMIESKAQERSLELVVPSYNLAFSTLTHHAQDRSKIALLWESASGRREVFSFFEIDQISNRIANVLTDLKTGFGDRVFTLLNRTPELYATILAVLKIGAAIAVLFPDFGPEAIRQRLADAEATVLITAAANLEKVRAVCDVLPCLEHVLVIGDFPKKNLQKCAVEFHNFNELVEKSSAKFVSANVSPDDTCFLIYTSGTTGLPKGVVHRHAIRERLIESAQTVLQLEKNDFFWCSADPGWVTGLC